MKTSIYQSLALPAFLLFALAACNDDLSQDNGPLNNKNRIQLSGEIDQVAVTRVNDNGFCNGDVMGVYIVDYQGSNPGTLQNNGNRGDNIRHTFDEANYKWNSAYDVYWKDNHTPIDVYGYYPFGSPTEVTSYEYEIQKDQNKAAEEGKLGGYEASDFLWGKTENVAPTEKVIRLPLRHRMSSAKVTLIEGTGFKENEWAGLEKSVLVRNIKMHAFINLQNGEVTATGEATATGTIPYKKDDDFRAIVVPQSVSSGTVLFSITVDGTPYTFKKEEAFTYISGKMHNFSIKVDRKEATGEYTFSLAGESITAWENDDVSHDATMKEYVVINSKAGQLKEAILEAKKDYRKLQNLKITGEIKADDFYFMRDSMDVLQSLNLKEVTVYGAFGYQDWSKTHDETIIKGMIPAKALDDKTSLLRIVLPDKLTGIGELAFRQCSNLTGSITIPEGVTRIGASAFLWCSSLTGSLSLPSTLEYIGGGAAVDRGGAFNGCNFTCELKLPNKLKYIGPQAFGNNPGYYGDLLLPEQLERIGDAAFENCKNLTGDLEIPQGVSIISYRAFAFTGLNGVLQLHDGITGIMEGAFMGTQLKGELTLPKNIRAIGESAFSGCDFSGELKLPKELSAIGDQAFKNNWRLMGILEFPDDLQTIGAGAFANCRSLEGLIFPEGLENIRYEAVWGDEGGAFSNCFGINSIVCKGTIPPYVQPGAFNGVAKDNFTLEVPESALQQYQASVGWNDFKRIAAHRELVCRPGIANAINTKCTRNLVLNAEGDWEVESMPDWCRLSQTSGSKKTELTLTIEEMSKGSAIRTGEIVFKLKDKDYRHKCAVSQYDYQYAEDEIITLQKATKGNRGGINLVFLGDGFDGKDISEGKYMDAMLEQVENFFGIEPYKTYRDYFNVYTAIAVSPETGIGTINTIRYAKFETTYTGGVGLKCDYQAAFNYALRMPTVTKDNLNESLVIMIPNSTDYGGICQMWEDGSAIAFCPMSTYGYPLDTRGVIQHEAGGHGFGKLGDEYIYHNEFIDFCTCTCCGHVFEFNSAKALGWYDNLSLTGKMHEVPWSHLIFDDRYSDIVDIYEGGFKHNRGVFRSEQNSCMNNDIPYYSTISRESIVKRIMRYAGETYTFEKFVENDKRDAGTTTRSSTTPYTGTSIRGFQMSPHIHKGSPLKNN